MKTYAISDIHGAYKALMQCYYFVTASNILQFSHPPDNDFSKSHNSSELFPAQIVLCTLQR